MQPEDREDRQDELQRLQDHVLRLRQKSRAEDREDLWDDVSELEHDLSRLQRKISKNETERWDLETEIERLHEESKRCDKHRTIFVWIAFAFIIAALAFGSWYFDLRGTIPSIERSARLDGWLEGYDCAYNATKTSYEKRLRYVEQESYDAGFVDGRDMVIDALSQGEYSGYWWPFCEEECCEDYEDICGVWYEP